MNAVNKGHCIFLFLLATLLYANTLTHDFALDDHIVITGNNFTKQGIEGIGDIMTHDAFVGAYGEALELTGGRYRPLSIVMFAVEYELFGLNPFVGHLMNLLLYALTGVLLYLFLTKLLPDKNSWIPLIAAALFVVHPIHTEVVANIKSRDEILELLFGIAVLLILFKEAKFYLYVLAPIVYFLALLSKENAITFLAIIPLTLFYVNRNTKEIIVRMVPLLAVTMVYLWMRSTYAGMVGDRVTTDIMDDPYLHASLSEKYATISSTLWEYLRLMLFPHPLSSDYSYDQIPLVSWANFKAFGALLLFGFFAVYATLNLKKRSLISYGILIFFITFSIVSNAVFNVGTSMAERFIYLPSVGFCLCIAVLLARVLKVDLNAPFSLSVKWLVPVILLIALASFKTIDRNRYWNNNYALYEEDVKHVPNSARIHLYYGIELITKFNKSQDQATLNQAIAEITKSTKINPAFHHAHYNLAVAYEKANNFNAAIQSYQNTLAVQPNHIKSNLNIGLLYGKVKNDLDKSIFYFNKLLNSNYKSDYLFDNLGVAYAMKGDLESAARIFAQGIEHNPKSAKLHLNLAITYDNLGRKDEAKKFYEIAFQLDPKLRQNQEG